MKALLVVVLLAVVAFFGYRQFFRPQVRACRQMARLCELDAAAQDRCVERLDELARRAEPQVLGSLDTCVVDAHSCPEAGGCFAGVGVKMATGALQQFFKGLGKSLQ